MENNEETEGKKNYNEIEVDNFDDILTENEDILRGVYGYGFTEVSRVQSKALQPIIDGVDLIVQSPAGTGKTGAYVVGGLTKINKSQKFPQMLVIVNTKELAHQVHKVISDIAQHMEINISLCIGGAGNLDVQKNLSQARLSQVLVGTPGRLVDIVLRDLKRDNKQKLLDRLKILILDEADKLLDDNFVENMKEIVKNKADDCQICLFSANYPRRIIELTQHFMNNPVRVNVEKEKLSINNTKHYYVNVEYNEYKYGVIEEIYHGISVCQTIIFTNEIKTANILADRLTTAGHAVGVTHADIDDITRLDTLKNFRLGKIRILVATDLIARGIDISSVGLVINYDVPTKPESYLHRAGRGGRYGKLGVTITLVTSQERDNRNMGKIESIFRVRFLEMPKLETVSSFLFGKNGYNFTLSS